MRHWHNTLLLAIPLGLGLAMPATTNAETTIPAGPFRSLAVHNGVEVLLRHGSSQGVKLLQGSLECVSVTIEGSDRLVIERLDDHVPRAFVKSFGATREGSYKSDAGGKCSHVHDLKLEVVTPEIGAVSLSDGATVRSLGDFPRQQTLQGAVANGGSLDLRSLTADYVTASVQSGGRIFTRCDGSLLAAVSQGGVVTYWGNAKVQSAIQHGGIVTRGKAADADKPFEAFAPAEPAPVMPVPPVPPTGY